MGSDLPSTIERREIAEKAPLRIGILTARPDRFENWELMVFDRLAADPRFSLVAFLVQPPSGQALRAPPLFAALASLEKAVLARQPSFVPGTFAYRTDQLRWLTPAKEPGGKYHMVADEAVADLDLVIRLTPEPLQASATAKLPFGEWAFNFCDQQSPTASWFGYADVIAGHPTTDLQLYARRGSATRPQGIAASSFNLKISAALQSAFLKERAVTLLMRELQRLAETRNLDTAPLSLSTVDPPSGAELARYGARLASHILARVTNRLQRRLGSGSAVWTLFTGHGRIDDFEPGRSVEIPPSMDDIKADPFLLQHEGQCFLFYEAYGNGDRKAHIAVGRFDGDRVERLGTALESKHHLSYPFVFKDGDDIFMMPETHQARRLEIWRCVEFPLKWELYSTALEGQSPADSVLVRHEGKWWLFTNLSSFHGFEDHCSELHVFEVDGPALRQVTPHRRNPVVIGSSVARNAGRIFARNGRLYRPSQYNAFGVYGYGLNIMEIEQLDLENYRERCIRTIAPDFKPGLYGCHHFDSVGDRYILDARLTH